MILNAMQTSTVAATNERSVVDWLVANQIRSLIIRLKKQIFSPQKQSQTPIWPFCIFFLWNYNFCKWHKVRKVFCLFSLEFIRLRTRLISVSNVGKSLSHNSHARRKRQKLWIWSLRHMLRADESLKHVFLEKFHALLEKIFKFTQINAEPAFLLLFAQQKDFSRCFLTF